MRNDETRDGPLDARDSHSAIDQVTHLFGRRGHVHIFVGDVLEQGDEVHFLLVMPAERHPRLLAHEGDDRLMIELRVVQPVQEVDGAGARRREADADLAGELRMRARHERGELLVPRLDEANPIARAIESAHDAVDAVPRISIDPGDVPLREPLEQVIRHSPGGHACTWVQTALR